MVITSKMMIRTIEGGITLQQMTATLCQRSLAVPMGLQSIVACPGLPEFNLPVLRGVAVERITALPEADWVRGAGEEELAISAFSMPRMKRTPGEAA